jgi:predicted secreted protein
MGRVGNPSPVAPAASVSPTGAAADKVYDQATTAITTAVGDHFFVVVPGNATTSFTWRVDPKPDESVLSVADPKYTPQPPPGCDAGCVGYGGTYAFGLTANAGGPRS